MLDYQFVYIYIYTYISLVYCEGSPNQPLKCQTQCDYAVEHYRQSNTLSL